MTVGWLGLQASLHCWEWVVDTGDGNECRHIMLVNPSKACKGTRMCSMSSYAHSLHGLRRDAAIKYIEMLLIHTLGIQ